MRMKARLLLAVSLMATIVAPGSADAAAAAGAAAPGAATLSPTRLSFTAPAGWTSAEDPNSRVIIVAPPGAKAAMTFAATREFSGTAGQWQHQMWTELLQTFRLAAPSESGVFGPFLTRLGIIQSPDGSRPWVCLYSLVNEGHGEAAIYLAADQQTFMAHLPAANQMIQGATVRASSASPAPAASRSAPAAGSGDRAAVAGLYLATTRQLRLNPLGGSGSMDWETRTEFYLLAADGLVFRGRDLPTPPGGDISRFDFAAARREAPGNYGTYAVQGDVVALRFPEESIDAKRLAPDALEIRSTKFTRSIQVSPAASGTTLTAMSPGPASDAVRPVLAYTDPPNFYRSAVQPPVAYTSNETNAGAEVYPFRPFTGDIVAAFRRTLLADWIDPQFRERPLAGPPEFFDVRVAGANAAIAARFHENNAGQPGERMRLLVVAGNQAALVDLHASSTAGWQRVGPALGALVDSLHIESKSAPPSLTNGPGPDAAKVAGLFMAFKSKYTAGLSGMPGTGGWKNALHYYAFSPDGRVHCCYDFPPGGSEQAWRQFDFDNAQRTDPDNTGRYRVDGNQLLIQMSGPNSSLITARIIDPNHLEIETHAYERQK
jgi:hypothetical protein